MDRRQLQWSRWIRAVATGDAEKWAYLRAGSEDRIWGGQDVGQVGAPFWGPL